MKTTRLSRRFAGVSSFAVPAIFIVACGGAPPPEAAPPSAPAKPAPVSTAADLSAVPEPAELVVTARLKKPSQAEKVVGGWTSLPMPGADDIADLVTDLDVGSIIDLDAPIDVAVAVEGHGKRIKPAFAVALGVKAGTAPGALPHVKSTPLGGGVFKLEGRGKVKSSDEGADSEDDDSSAANICEVIPAYGPSASRLVCGSSEGAITALGPYLARTAPRVSYPADLHIEGRLDPVRETISQARQVIPMLIGGLVSDSKAGPAVQDLITAALGDFVDAALDLDRIKIDANLTDPGATATVTTSFRETKSLMALLAVAHPERADVAPASFWHLPADSKGAFFGRGIDAKDLEHPRELLTDAMSKTLDAKGIAPADRAAIADVFTQYFALLSSPMVFANGFDAATAAAPATTDPKKPAAKKDDKTHEERKDAEARGAWAIAGIDAPIAKVANVGKSIATTLHRPGVAKLVKEAMPDGIPAPVIVTAAVPAKLGLPKDTVHLTVTVVAAAEDQPSFTEASSAAQKAASTTDGPKSNPSKKTAVAAKPKVKLGKPFVLHWYFVPDAGRTWVGYGADETVIAAHLKLALSTSTDPGTLQSRAGLEDLKTAKLGSGGFFTLRGILAPSPLEPIFHTHDRDMERMLTRLQGAPQKGETPMPIELRSTAPAGQGAGALEITVKIPRESVRDVVAAAIGR